jgi:hypothetical protein
VNHARFGLLVASLIFSISTWASPGQGGGYGYSGSGRHASGTEDASRSRTQDSRSNHRDREAGETDGLSPSRERVHQMVNQDAPNSRILEIEQDWDEIEVKLINQRGYVEELKYKPRAEGGWYLHKRELDD